LVGIIVGSGALLLLFSTLRQHNGTTPAGRAAGGELPDGCGADVLTELPEDIFSMPPMDVSPPSFPVQAQPIEGRFLVRLDETLLSEPFFEDDLAKTGLERLDQALERIATRSLRRMDERLSMDAPRSGLAWTLELQTDLAAEEVLEALRGQEGVRWAEPVQRVFASGTPNDPYYPYQWHLSTIGVTGAWETSQGKGAVVAVLDTGVSQEMDGLNELLDGYDFASDDSDASDESWHGTHVAGTIAQATNNALGVSSVAPQASILPVRVLNAEGTGSTAELVEGIYWAVEQGAHIINMSLSFSSEEETVAEACVYAEEQGVLLVAAAGNDGRSSYVGYPAAYETVLAVGATDLNGDLAHYSNQGDELDIVAPGGDLSHDQDGDGLMDGVLQAAPLDGEWTYLIAEGTSMATPHVSGVAALLVAAGVEAPEDLRDALLLSAEDLGEQGWDKAYGHGLLDPAAALARAPAGADPGDDEDDATEGGEDGGGAGGGVSETEGGTTFSSQRASGCSG